MLCPVHPESDLNVHCSCASSYGFCLWIASTDRCFALFKSMNGMRCSIALRFDLFNASNLLLQRGHVLLHFLHALFQRVLVFFKDDTAFSCGGCTLAAQLGKA